MGQHGIAENFNYCDIYNALCPFSVLKIKGVAGRRNMESLKSMSNIMMHIMHYFLLVSNK